jgi:formate hydrogenlyase subunit 3/multisubunit Na+/H+ antiporter MnhD subunit
MKKVTIFGQEPAVIVYSVNALVALLVAYGLDLSQEQTAAVSSIATAVVAIIVTVMTRPIVVSALTGAVTTLMTAVAGFGLEFTADQIGATVTVLSIVLGLVLRANVTPTSGPVQPSVEGRQH